MLDDNNFYLTFGWMLNRLKLKGSELTAFAIIYSFTQDGVNWFTGGLKYIADFGNMTKQTAITALKKLVEKNYIIKKQTIENNVTYNAYQVNLEVVKKFEWGSQKSLTGWSKNLNEGSQKFLPNNKEYIEIDNKKDIYCQVIEYLNEKAGKEYSYKTESTQHHINARLNEGYTLDDFKKVIDNKCKDWLNTDMDKFLRPITLFNTKFESYLNQKDNSKAKQSYCEY